MNGNNSYYPSFKIRQGSRRDFVGAWCMRILATVLAAAIIWICSLILSGVMYLVNTLPPMQVKVDRLVTDVAELKVAQAAAKEEIKTAAEVARQELESAEMRVKNEFKRQLEEQIDAAKLQTGGTLKRGRQ